MSDQSWLSTKEAAILLGVSQRTIQNWVDIGKIKSTKTVGGHRRLSRDDLKQRMPDTNIVQGKNHDTHSSNYDVNPSVVRVLVVEDDFAVLRLCELHFAQFSVPHQLYLTSNAYQGLIMVGKYQPHIIFTDLNMPEINGLRMIREIKQIPEMKNTKIVIVTGLGAKEIQKMGPIPEDIMVLPKPIPFNTVETMLYQQMNAINQSLEHYPALVSQTDG